MKRLMGLFLVLVLVVSIAACDGADETGDTGTTGEGETGDGEVAMENISFQPGETTVAVGTTVTWSNEDGVSHTTTSEETVWDSGTMAGGDTFSFSFDEPGTYAYFCEIHPDRMRATITVEG
jgi:plastocyanin